MKFFIFLLFTCFLMIKAETVTFTDHKVIRVIPRIEKHLLVIKQLENVLPNLDFWYRPSGLGEPVDIRLTPIQFTFVTTSLNQAGMPYKVLISDLQSAIDVETFSNNVRFSNTKADSVTTKFFKHQEINAWLDRLVKANPSFLSVQSIGNTTQNREMKILKISSGSNTPKESSIIWMDAGIHAREWITPATCLYIITKLVDQAKQGTLKNDWHILPSANPDGYEYSQTSNRMWRKTRSGPRKSTGWMSKNCYGVDPNRNFDNHFGQASTSSDSCSDIYCGPKAFSEPETRNIKDHILKHKENMKAYLSLHSYSQLILTPVGYSTAVPADNTDLMRVANNAKNAIKAVNGRSFTVGQPSHILYAASGGSYDWARENAGIKYSYTFELFPSKYNWQYSNGFIIPASEIAAAGAETWAGIEAIVDSI